VLLASTTPSNATMAIGKVSWKLACARIVRPLIGLGGGSASSRAPTFQLRPYCAVLKRVAVKMWTNSSSAPSAAILSSIGIQALPGSLSAVRAYRVPGLVRNGALVHASFTVPRHFPFKEVA